jgi:putative transposase
MSPQHRRQRICRTNTFSPWIVRLYQFDQAILRYNLIHLDQEAFTAGVVRTGCSWRMLPLDFPHWDNVYKTFRQWSAQGKFELMHDRLRSQWREREERTDSPSATILDAQSTRSSPQGGNSGYDAGKKVNGRERSLIVDTLGLLLSVSISAESVQDRDVADDAVAYSKEKYP